MNRKQRIIVSITGIILVSLILIGLTYAYFLTKITGNTNDKSISVSTANLQIKYEDNKEEILGENLILEPSDNEIGSKTFTVTNEGNKKTSYVVVVENVSITNSSDGKTTTFESNDFRYTLTCTKKDGASCEQINTQSIFPIDGGLLVTNSIDVDDVQSYILKMWYIDTGKDQSNDMGKTYNAKLNILDLRASSDKINPYSTNKKALNYQIINSALEGGKNRTKLGKSITSFTDISTDNTTYQEEEIPEVLIESSAIQYGDSESSLSNYIGKDTSCNTLIGKYTNYPSNSVSKIIKCNGNIPIVNAKIIEYEKLLNTAPDDYGTSYYFRGDIQDNYVSFAGLTWRIVRINGDGSIRLILNNSLDSRSLYNTNSGDNAYIGYMYGTPGSTTYNDTHKNINESTVKSAIDQWYENNIESDTNNKHFEKYLADTLFCGDKEISSGSGVGTDNTIYNATKRLSTSSIATPTFECTKDASNNYSRYTSKLETSTLTTKGVEVNNDLKHPIALITADEIVFAGGFDNKANKKYYLADSTISMASITMTPNSYDHIYSVISAGYELQKGFEELSMKIPMSIKPVINLKSTVLLNSGDGTKTNPYTVE